jgi:hypothetical protein
MKPLFRHAVRLMVLFAIVVVAGQARAQMVSHTSSSVDEAIDKWSKENGVIVTKDVRDQLARNSAIKFVTGAPEVGLKTIDAWQLGGVIADGGTVEYTSRGKTVLLKGKSGAGNVVAYASALPSQPDRPAAGWSDFLSSLVDYVKIGEFLQTYPRLHLVVQPVPPRDYSVKINGRTYQPTEAALYGVVAGAIVRVRIERAGKPPCEWTGTVSDGQVQNIPCTL